MKTRTIFMLTMIAAAAAAFAPLHGQDRSAPLPQSRVGTPSSGVLGILQHGNYECALPGDAGGEPFIAIPEESFRIGTASSYVDTTGSGIYLMRGDEVLFTRGPKKDQRFQKLGDNTLQKLNADGTLSKLICTRLGGIN